MGLDSRVSSRVSTLESDSRLSSLDRVSNGADDDDDELAAAAAAPWLVISGADAQAAAADRILSGLVTLPEWSAQKHIACNHQASCRVLHAHCTAHRPAAPSIAAADLRPRRLEE